MKELRERNRNRNQTEDVTVVPDSEPEPEEIEQFSDPTLGLPRKRKLSQPPSHRVRDAVQVLELQRKHQEKPVRRLDLKTVNSVAGKMKPKSLPVRNLWFKYQLPRAKFAPQSGLVKNNRPKPEVDFVNDPATAPSLGPSSTKSKKAAKIVPSTPKCTFLLPLEAWTYGFNLFKSSHTERYLFCWDEPANKILIQRASPEKHLFDEFDLHKTAIEDITVCINGYRVTRPTAYLS